MTNHCRIYSSSLRLLGFWNRNAFSTKQDMYCHGDYLKLVGDKSFLNQNPFQVIEKMVEEVQEYQAAAE